MTVRHAAHGRWASHEAPCYNAHLLPSGLAKESSHGR